MRTSILAVALAAFAMVAAVPAAAAGMTGKWNFTLQTEGGERQFSPTFQLDGENVTGKWGAADVKGTFSGDTLNLNFPFTSEEAELRGTLKITGKLADGALTGQWQFESYSGSFRAVPAERPAQASAAGLAGNWECTVEADRTHNVTLTLSENAGTWSGRIGSPNGELPLQNVKVEDGAVSFTVDLNSSPIAFKVKVNGDRMEGTWNASSNSGTLKGVKKAG